MRLAEVLLDNHWDWQYVLHDSFLSNKISVYLLMALKNAHLKNTWEIRGKLLMGTNGLVRGPTIPPSIPSAVFKPPVYHCRVLLLRYSSRVESYQSLLLPRDSLKLFSKYTFLIISSLGRSAIGITNITN